MRTLNIIFFIGLMKIFMFSCDLRAEPLQFEIKGQAAILINAQTGVVLFEKEPHIPRFPASTTKVATALFALKKKEDGLNELIEAKQEALVTITPEVKRKSNYTLPSHWLETDGTHIGLKKGEILTFHDLLRGMLICSGNDAANLIALTLSPSIPEFMDELNAYLKELGCKQTHFCNPHGLHHPEHVSTPHDLALIAREALKNPIISDIISQPRFLRPKTNKQAATTLLQGNRLIRSGKLHYSKAIGVKTGGHSKSKNTFIGAAKSDGRTLILVLLGYQNRTEMFEDAIKIFDKAFNQPKIQRRYLKSGPQSFKLNIPKAKVPLETYLSEDLSLDFYPAEDPQAKCLLYWQTLSLPIMKDQKVGELHLISYEGVILKKIDLFAKEEVGTFWLQSWLESLSSWFWLIIFGVGLVCLAVYLKS